MRFLDLRSEGDKFEVSSRLFAVFLLELVLEVES